MRLGMKLGWPEVIWKAPNDYQWTGKTRVHATNFSEGLGEILKDYPLQADFYDGNHILVIIPRTLKA